MIRVSLCVCINFDVVLHESSRDITRVYVDAVGTDTVSAARDPELRDRGLRDLARKLLRRRRDEAGIVLGVTQIKLCNAERFSTSVFCRGITRYSSSEPVVTVLFHRAVFVVIIVFYAEKLFFKSINCLFG